VNFELSAGPIWEVSNYAYLSAGTRRIERRLEIASSRALRVMTMPACPIDRNMGIVMYFTVIIYHA
jgi:hypothetical protein